MKAIATDMGPSQAPRSACEVEVSSDAPEWGAYLAGRREATIYHEPRWAEIMAEAYGNTPFYLTARRGGEVVGVLSLVWQRSLLFGTHLCSLPYFDAAGIVADDAAARDVLIEAARRLGEDCRAEWVELRQGWPVDGTLATRTDKVGLELRLPADPEELWTGLKAKVRNQVRKARKAGLTAGPAGRESLPEFHAVYCRTMRDLGSPAHSRRFFELICDRFGERARLYAVWADARAVAAGFTLADGDVMHVPWAASDWRLRQDCPNMLLYWTMLEDACNRGVKVFDFGRSTRGEGTYRFKTQWGAAECQLHWQYLLADGQEMPSLRPDSPKYRAMVACWRKLPVGLTRAIGPRIIAKLS